MERKNTVLLTVIAVATLLVAVVGATFAYFTATNPTAPEVNDATGEAATAKVADITLSATKIDASTNVIWPGTKNYVGVSVSASKGEDGTVEDDYEVTYTVKGTVQATQEFTKGDVTWNLYESDTPVEKPIDCPEVSNANSEYSQVCTLDSALTSKSVDSGTLSSTDESEVSYQGKVSTAGGTKYYYLVVEYENDTQTDQTDDAGGTKSITYAINEITVDSTAVAS